MFIFLCALCSAIFLALLGVIVQAFQLKIGPVPSSRKVSLTLLTFISPAFHGVIVDLGAGWGTLLAAIAHHAPHSQLIGYERSFLPYCFLRLRFLRHTRVKIFYRDFFKEKFKDETLLVSYLYPKAMDRLEKKLKAEKFKGTLLTHTFALPSTSFECCRKNAEDLYHTPVYLYRFTHNRH